MRRTLATFGLAFALAASTAPAHACPGCKEGVADQSPEEAARYQRGYSNSVLMMVSMPFLLLGAGSFMVVRAVRRGALPPL